ncbi:cysteine-rich CWC family protein [Olivibacter domesticus]|uniref:cysteine-rich CWC family protein n=1 Tax=Olivibacter domesticus TaxID=407022 RepID=UPI000B869060|nr:cysteine-rich CWC family protein [Olivibacter domesticus]
MNSPYIKHEIVACERCYTLIECRANSYAKCQCSIVDLSINEMQFISEQYDGCLCAKCLGELKEQYHQQTI